MPREIDFRSKEFQSKNFLFDPPDPSNPLEWPLLLIVALDGGSLEVREGQDGSVSLRSSTTNGGVADVTVVLNPHERYELTRMLAKGIRK